MKRSMRLVQFDCLLIFIFTAFIEVNATTTEAETCTSHKHAKVSEDEYKRKSISEAVRTYRWSLEQQGNISRSLTPPSHTFRRQRFMRREALQQPYSGEMIRLRSHGKNVNSGIVEVYFTGQWGYICSDGWDQTDAIVACKELGFHLGAPTATNLSGAASDKLALNHDILMNNLKCSGTEESLTDCPFSLLNDCSLHEIGSVNCESDVECPKNWKSGLGKCYKFYTKAKTIEHASTICSSEDASLVTIDSVKENHFLSNLLKKTLPNINQWYTGGQKIGNKWQWMQTVTKHNGSGHLFAQVLRKAHPVIWKPTSDISFDRWFPGWPSYNNSHSEPVTKNEYHCLTLSNVYQDPITKAPVVVDYFFWKAAKCASNPGMSFICQMQPKKKTDVTHENCYTKNGASYRGIAAVTDKGLPCAKWSLSSTINDKTHPENGLGEHNFCRNPNGGIKPWCWVNHELGSFEFCNLPECSTENKPEDTESECYTQDGSSYRGNVSVTVKGSKCLPWSLSASSNDKTHPGKGLGDHNFCRNPDGSRQPWCWVNHEHNMFGFCKLSKCSEEGSQNSDAYSYSDIRLVGGKNPNEGNVEVTIGSQKYRVCHNAWDDKEASVICRMLGFSDGGIATNNSFFGSETFGVVSEDFQCTGSELHLRQCSLTVSPARHNCSPKTLAGAICTRNNQTNPNNMQENRGKGICGRRPFEHQSKLIKVKNRPNFRKVSKNTSHLRKLVRARIIHGRYARHGEYPWQARFHLILSTNCKGEMTSGSHHCGGAIISEFWILSAAHCFIDQRLNSIVAFVGDHNITFKDVGEQKFTLEKVILHENYDDDTKDFDIALIKVKPTDNGHGIQFNNYVQPVCLPDQDVDFTSGMKCSVSGWGYIKTRETEDTSTSQKGYPDTLKAAELPLISPADCEKLYKTYNPSFSQKRMFCAGYLAGGTDTCDGDSGGPLVCNMKGVYTVQGIVSWGNGCALKNMPGVYSRIFMFVPWIETTIKTHSKSQQEIPRKS